MVLNWRVHTWSLWCLSNSPLFYHRHILTNTAICKTSITSYMTLLLRCVFLRCNVCDAIVFAGLQAIKIFGEKTLTQVSMQGRQAVSSARCSIRPSSLIQCQAALVFPHPAECVNAQNRCYAQDYHSGLSCTTLLKLIHNDTGNLNTSTLQRSFMVSLLFSSTDSLTNSWDATAVLFYIPPASAWKFSSPMVIH
jgi:hypothetical protein